MELTNEMLKMLSVIKENDLSLRKYMDMKKCYFAPEIPEKVLKNLIKNFDSHIGVNSLVAVYDGSLLHKLSEGIVFTNDGIYFKDILTKPVYFRYMDIVSMDIVKDSLIFTLINCDEDKYTHIGTFDYDTLKFVIEELKVIDNEFGQTSLKSSGKVKKLAIPKNMLDKCNGIIHAASISAGGVGTGLAQIPASDNAVIVPIQVGMIVGLGAVFELNITEAVAKSIISSAAASFAGRTLSQFLVGWIPGVGNVINTATAAGITEAIGWIAVKNFYERWLEDKDKGRLEGMKDGYIEASGEYERKLRKQAEEFLNQKKDIQKEHDEYEKLLDEYEKYISELEAKCVANNQISENKLIYNKLKGLESA